jgi:hypothetical protein
MSNTGPDAQSQLVFIEALLAGTESELNDLRGRVLRSRGAGRNRLLAEIDETIATVNGLQAKRARFMGGFQLRVVPK